MLPEAGAVQVQVAVGEPDGRAGASSPSTARPAATASRASGPATRPAPSSPRPGERIRAWRPRRRGVAAGGRRAGRDRRPLRAAGRGGVWTTGRRSRGCGPAWRRGEELFAEVALGDEQARRGRSACASTRRCFDAGLHGARPQC